MSNRGHGHVYPRDDGIRARCGGPNICPDCALEFSMKNTPLKTSMPLMTVDEMCTVIDNAKNEIIKLREALSFIQDLSAECLSNGDVRVGQGAEVAMRHINRKANEVLK